MSLTSSVSMDYIKRFDKFVSIRDDSEQNDDKLRANHDLKPTPPEERTWHLYNYLLIWFQSSFNINEWNTGASLIKTSGLPYKQVLGSGILGIFISCFFTVLNARQGSDYHIGYPVLARSTFGIRLAYFMVFVRMFVATIWFGVMTYYGSLCLDVVFRCMFGHRWTDIPNHLPENSNTSTRLMLVFFIYWLLQFPLMFVHPKFIRHFFTVKAIIMPFATLGLFIFCVVRGHGPGDWSVGVKTTSTSSAGIQWLSSINTILGTVSPMIINQPDTSRYAKRKEDTVVPQVIGYIPSKILVFLFGTVSVCSLFRAYGTAYWNIWDMFAAILDNEWSAGARTGIWFVSLAFAIGNAGTNIFANSIPFSCDLCGLLPKYFTIVRAQVLVGFLAWAIVPWKFLENATKFITFLGSYSIFVGPLLGALLADFYVIRRGNLHVPSLYSKRPDGIYYYFKGCNIESLICWIVSIVIAVPGLYRAYYPTKLTQQASDIYSSGWLFTFLMCFVLHSVCGLIRKPKIYPDSHSDAPTTWEYMVPTNGFFEDDEPINGVGYPSEINIEDDQEGSSSIPSEKKTVTDTTVRDINETD